MPKGTVKWFNQQKGYALFNPKGVGARMLSCISR
jgi:cold shock CspA family protein